MQLKSTQKITPCLWFDTNAEEAVNFYKSVFKKVEIGGINHYKEDGPLPEGNVLTIRFHIDGQEFLALNGGPAFKFSEAISFIINCDTQEEIDYFWDKLSEGGKIQQCGWVKDKFGLSWQVVPSELPEMLLDEDSEKATRTLKQVLQMVKLDIPTLRKAFEND